ncbi:MAG: adenosylcobalamin-dependent ribonucleoside-diphosphate reductase [Candidatus Pacearchaeota archaeon]|nr:adenosylcobalamin-dependent ribonucleoside-diphosphate reductase [Candidatus Pacearchaeota archaeon]
MAEEIENLEKIIKKVYQKPEHIEYLKTLIEKEELSIGPRLYESYDKNKTKELEKKLITLPHVPEFSENSISILKKRYFKKDENGIALEDVRGLMARVAANIAYPDFYYEGQEAFEKTGKEFYEMMVKREFVPNSPTLMNAGREMQQLAACFVLPIDDDMNGPNGILTQIRNAGTIHKSGGGTGFSFSNLRRKNHFVSTTYGKASGPVSFIGAYAAITNSINQGGFRRGANMGCMIVDHPDSLEFILAKTEEGTFPSFNFSVLLTDAFMEALEKDEYFTLYNRFKGEAVPLTIKDIEADMRSVEEGLLKYEELNFKIINGKVIETNSNLECRINEKGEIQLRTKDVFEIITKAAWRNGEPGVLFIDTINKYNTVPGLGKIESTNPCGEQPLLPYEACNLGSINLGLMVKERKVDYERLEEIVRRATHFLDNVIDMSNYPLPQIDAMVRKTRKIGLGIMGWADMLVKLRIPYDSEEALKLAEEVMHFINKISKDESKKLAQKRGPFPAIDKSIYKEPIRNATTTTIAPTGTIGIIAGASGGIEPYFGLIYTHTDADGQKRRFVVEELEKALKERGINPESILEKIEKNKGSLKGMEEIPEDIRKIFVTSRDIATEWHVKMQAAFQKYTDNAVSKTINLPNNATVEDVQRAYLLAYKLGCKGITVYRDESREKQVLETKAEEEFVKICSLPDTLPSLRHKEKTGCGSIYVNIPYEEKNSKKYPREIFASMGKAGGCLLAQIEGLCRIISLALRANVDPKEIINQLVGIRCNRPYIKRDDQILSCPDAIAKSLEKFLSQNGNEKDKQEIKEIVLRNVSYLKEGKQGGLCKQCGKGILIPSEGCREGKCPECGWSPCS